MNVISVIIITVENVVRLKSFRRLAMKFEQFRIDILSFEIETINNILKKCF